MLGDKKLPLTSMSSGSWEKHKHPQWYFSNSKWWKKGANLVCKCFRLWLSFFIILLFYYNSLSFGSVRRMKYRLSYKVETPQPQPRYQGSRNKQIFTTQQPLSNCKGSPWSIGPWKGLQSSGVHQRGKGRAVTGCRVVLCTMLLRVPSAQLRCLDTSNTPVLLGLPWHQQQSFTTPLPSV